MGWPADSETLHPDKSSVVAFDVVADGVEWWTTHAAIVPTQQTIPTGVTGHYFVLDTAPQFRPVPFVVEFNEGANDVVVLAYKVKGTQTHVMGVTVDRTNTVAMAPKLSPQHLLSRERSHGHALVTRDASR